MSAPNGDVIGRALLEKAADWRARAMEGLTREENDALDLWLRASELNQAAYERVERAWDTIGDIASDPEVAAMRSAALATAQYKTSPLSFSSVMRVAAATILAIALFAGGVWLADRPTLYQTGPSERRVVALQDGSHISLDAATQVRVRLRPARREISLERGRAKFDVARDPLRPFLVTAENRTIVATGTSFSVELLNDQVRVVLYEGSVSVLGPSINQRADSRATVAQSEQVALATSGLELVAPGRQEGPAHTSAIDPVRSLAWESGVLIFEEEPLLTAVARVNRYSGVHLLVIDPAVAQLRVNGVFRAGDSTAFLEGVTAVLPIREQPEADGVYLVSDPTRISQ